MKRLKDLAPIIVFVITAIANNEYNLLDYITTDLKVQDLIKIVGTLVLAYITNKRFSSKSESKEEGGAISPNTGM